MKKKQVKNKYLKKISTKSEHENSKTIKSKYEKSSLYPKIMYDVQLFDILYIVRIKLNALNCYN